MGSADEAQRRLLLVCRFIQDDNRHLETGLIFLEYYMSIQL